ncbi:hypothetical protein GP486_005316 [Trichoglossum hirsutum]|uniref:Uncharacterized protein n=1 Tax=Trichoglossum hirsutum TaxID=265104 RepID=A0A9P8L9B6_9PEZI|nr:hypothetical protein GP486_005316 [Trichoglossum hirsutum]
MGGILSAEAVLLPHLGTDGLLFRHRILGTINFDTPFLGMHPGVIVSGIGSLFRPSPVPIQPHEYPEEIGPSPSSQRPPHYSSTSPPLQDSGSHASPASSLAPFQPTPTLPALASTDSHYPTVGNTDPQLSSAPPADPNYNPPFSNDVRLSNRSGWDSALHFVLKHSGNLPTATRTYIMSHLEFGGCLADYDGLKSRYAKIRKLEDVDDISSIARPAGSRNSQRVRFVNYYTTSTGRPKRSHVLGHRTAQEDTEASEQHTGSQGEAEAVTTQDLSGAHISDKVRQGPGAVDDTMEAAPRSIQDDILGMGDEDSLLSEDNPTRDPANFSAPAGANKKHPRFKKFCKLPPKIAGRIDPTWVSVFMEGVDEVGAHCSLFFLGQAYERLVGDVGIRIEEWVREEETRRVISQLEESNYG